MFSDVIRVISHEHVLDILYRKALREIARRLHERATNTITGTTVSEVCIVKASISHRTWFCRCQGSLVGSQRRWWKDACRWRDGAGTERETRKEGWERERREASGAEKERSLSLPWREARVIQLVIDLRNISRFTSTEPCSCSFLALLRRLLLLLLLLLSQSALPISSTGCRFFPAAGFNEFEVSARL